MKLDTPQEREDFYDREVAPVLFDLGRRCKDAGLSFLAQVEWERGEVGTTCCLVEGHGNQMDWAQVVLRTANVDLLISTIVKYARQHGHSSIFLHQLGVPAEPEMAGEA